jgi:membrane-bound inhibitor of C-type lysozyme
MNKLTMAAALLLAACSPNPDQIVKEKATEPTQVESQPVEPPAAWTCEDGRQMTVAFYGDRVTLTFADGAMRSLPGVVAASGEAYEADGLRFHAKGGEEAYLEQGGSLTNCRKSATE